MFPIAANGWPESGPIKAVKGVHRSGSNFHCVRNWLTGKSLGKELRESKCAHLTYQVSNLWKRYGRWKIPGTKKEIGPVWRLLHRQTTDIADVKLGTLLDWVSDHVRDFPLSGPLQSEARQVVGQRLFDIARDSDAEACGHFATWGTIMAAFKGISADVGHYAASEADSPEPSAPPEPVSDASSYS